MVLFYFLPTRDILLIFIGGEIYNMPKELHEYNLSTDHFNMPEVIKNREAVGLLISRLILLEPGTNPNRPEMGVGLVSHFREMFPNDLPALKKRLYDQLSTYLPEYANAQIELTAAPDNQLSFKITIDDMVFKYVTVEQEDNKVTLAELQETQ